MPLFRGWPHATLTPRPLKRSPDAASQPAVAAMLIQDGCSLGRASAVDRLPVQSMVSLRSGWGRHGGEAATAPREQPGLDDELHPAGGRADGGPYAEDREDIRDAPR